MQVFCVVNVLLICSKQMKKKNPLNLIKLNVIKILSILTMVELNFLGFFV